MDNDIRKRKNSNENRSKSKRNLKQGGSLLKAYFPNLISAKDPNKARGSDINPQKKKLFHASKSQAGESVGQDINLFPGAPEQI